MRKSRTASYLAMRHMWHDTGISGDTDCLANSNPTNPDTNPKPDLTNITDPNLLSQLFRTFFIFISNIKPSPVTKVIPRDT